MRDEQRRDGDASVERRRHAVGQRSQFDVLQRDELRPRSVLLEIRTHARHRQHGHAACAEDFASQVGEAEVVADVGVRQQDAVDDRRTRTRRPGDALEPMELRRKIGRGVDDPPLAAPRIDDAERCDERPRTLSVERLDAIRPPAPRLRIPAILRDAQDDDVRIARGRDAGAGEEQEYGREAHHARIVVGEGDDREASGGPVRPAALQ
jgi:hypothetical protein